MDFMGEASFAGGNMIPDSTSNGSGFDNWGPGFSDQAVWATEDDYRDWNTGPSSETPSSSNRSGSEPPHKKSRSSQGADSHVTSRSKAIGKMFFKTKLCCKFRAGVCPYINNCNFAHGIEELHKPPPNWQEIVAEHESEDGGGGGVMLESREEHQIPTVSSPELCIETQRSFKGRHCKKFYTEEGCPYGDTCTFLHDEQSRARESVAISVTPTVGGFGNNAAGANLKPSNWKTRICNKWETTGYCPFGSKCHFAHGAAALQKWSRGNMICTPRKRLFIHHSRNHMKLSEISLPVQNAPRVAQVWWRVDGDGRQRSSIYSSRLEAGRGFFKNNREYSALNDFRTSHRCLPFGVGRSSAKALWHSPESWPWGHSEMERAR